MGRTFAVQTGARAASFRLSVLLGLGPGGGFAMRGHAPTSPQLHKQQLCGAGGSQSEPNAGGQFALALYPASPPPFFSETQQVLQGDSSPSSVRDAPANTGWLFLLPPFFSFVVRPPVN